MTVPPSASDLDAPGSPEPLDRRLLVALLLSLFLTGLDSSVVNVMLPELQKVFATDVSRTALVGTVYVAAMAAFQLTFGRLADLVPALRVFAAGIALFWLGSLGCALSGSLWHLLVARTLQGLGGGILAASFGAVVLVCIPKHKTGSTVGAALTVMTVGALVGPPLGGFLAESQSWRWAFLINLPIGAIAMLSLLPLLRRPIDGATSHWRNFDRMGALLSTLFFLLWPAGLHLAGERGWNSPLTGVTLVAAALVAGLWWRTSQRSPRPLLDFSVLARPGVRGLLALKLLLFVLLNGVLLVFPFFITSRPDFQASDAGWLIACCALAMALSTPLIGRAVDRWGGEAVMTLSGALITLALAAGLAFPAHPSRGQLALLLAALGASLACMMVSSTTALLQRAPSGQEGIFSALNSLASPLGAALGFSLFATLYGGAGLGSDADAFQHWRLCLKVMLALALGMTGLAQACRQGGPKAPALRHPDPS